MYHGILGTVVNEGSKLNLNYIKDISIILLLFTGKGYSALVLGNIILVWACNKIEVSFDNDAMESMDIPITYTKNGVQIRAFADTKTFKIKSTSKSFPKNDVLHPAYFIENSWYCKVSSSYEIIHDLHFQLLFIYIM